MSRYRRLDLVCRIETARDGHSVTAACEKGSRLEIFDECLDCLGDKLLG